MPSAAESAAAHLVAAVRDFVERVDALDQAPGGPEIASLEIRAGSVTTRLALRAPVAQSLAEALRQYRDPRDLGGCDHCGGRRLDHNFVCRDCGMPNGVFGRLVMERANRHHDPLPIDPPPRPWAPGTSATG